MRGSDQRSGSLFSYVDLESRVRRDHPLRPIREIVNGALAELNAEFEALYAAGVGRPSIPPERLLRALLLQAYYGVRSERQIMWAVRAEAPLEPGRFRRNRQPRAFCDHEFGTLIFQGRCGGRPHSIPGET